MQKQGSIDPNSPAFILARYIAWTSAFTSAVERMSAASCSCRRQREDAAVCPWAMFMAHTLPHYFGLAFTISSMVAEIILIFRFSVLEYYPYFIAYFHYRRSNCPIGFAYIYTDSQICFFSKGIVTSNILGVGRAIPFGERHVIPFYAVATGIPDIGMV